MSMITRMEAIQGIFFSRAQSHQCVFLLLLKVLFPYYSYSCGEGEDYHQFLNRNRNRHNRRLFRRLNNINHNHLDSQQIIPRQNVRLRSLFDRINQEIEKYRRKRFADNYLLIHRSKTLFFSSLYHIRNGAKAITITCESFKD